MAEDAAPEERPADNEAPPASAVEESSPGGSSTGQTGRPPLLLGRLPSMLVMIVVAASVGSAGGEILYGVRETYVVPPELVGMPPYPPDVERMLWVAYLKNMMLGFGIAGGLICGTIGVLLGVLYRSAGAAVKGLLIGTVAGALLGAGGGVLDAIVENRLFDVTLDSIFKTMLIRLPNFLLLGTAVGLTLTTALGPGGQFFKYVVGGISAGLIAAILYPLVSVAALPAQQSDLMIPYQLGTRMLWHALCAALLGCAALRLVK